MTDQNVAPFKRVKTTGSVDFQQPSHGPQSLFDAGLRGHYYDVRGQSPG